MITMQGLARKAGLLTLPPGGAWVAIKGCPSWPRGNRLISAHRAIGIRHMDVYWACKEELTFSFKVNRYRRRNLSLPFAVFYDQSQGESEERAIERAVGELLDYLAQTPYHSAQQQSYITISHPHPEEIRFFNGEVAVFSNETIRMLLAENGLKTIIFGQAVIPVLEDAIAEMSDAMRLDGLSKSEAYQELLTAGAVEQNFVPTWFYRSAGAFREQFCEEGWGKSITRQGI